MGFWNGYKKKGLIGLVHLRQWGIRPLLRSAFLHDNACHSWAWNRHSAPNSGSSSLRSKKSLPSGWRSANRCVGINIQFRASWTFAFTSSTAPWKTRLAIGIEASARLPRPPPHDHPTTLHALDRSPSPTPPATGLASTSENRTCDQVTDRVLRPQCMALRGLFVT
jgi:hypothetical protein